MNRGVLFKLLFWILLAVPAAMLVSGFWHRPVGVEADRFLHPSGEFSARLLIFALVLTPLSQLLPHSGILRWLLRHRRSIGVAAFGYAALHLFFYSLDKGAAREVISELRDPAIWTGWLAFLCMLVPATVSNDRAMRALKAGWKRIQRLAYPAAILTLIHWAMIAESLTDALVNFAPLILLQLIRLVRLLTGKGGPTIG